MNALIISLAPQIAIIVVAVVGYIYHIVAIHIPAQQRAYLEQWGRIVALKAEQFGAGKTNAEKKQMAMNDLVGFFSAFKLPVPPLDILSAAIEAAVNLLPATNPAPIAPAATANAVPTVGTANATGTAV